MSIVLTGEEMSRAIKRISHEIVERNGGTENVILLGIPTRGVTLAARIADFLSSIGEKVQLGTLDTTLHRDDLRQQPPRPLLPTRIPPGGISGREIVLVDDVFFSGRTIRAALDAINEIGRPRRVQLAVLIDRGHRELPIRADFVGKNIPTAPDEKVKVHFSEQDGDDFVELITPASSTGISS